MVGQRFVPPHLASRVDFRVRSDRRLSNDCSRPLASPCQLARSETDTRTSTFWQEAPLLALVLKLL